MHYIVFDLEFNQDYPSQFGDGAAAWSKKINEIIQIGAVKLDGDFQTIGTFNRYVKPTFIKTINAYVSELTGIKDEQLSSEKTFPHVLKEFVDYIEGQEAIFCVWGLTDIKEIYRNASYHDLDLSHIPGRFINVQPYVSKYFKLSTKKLLGLETAVERLDITKCHPFHNAMNDAWYTTEVFKRIMNSSITPVSYDPSTISRRRQARVKSEIDFDALHRQLSKMYARELSDEEISMVKLAYKMGRTGQFIKEIHPNS